MRRGLLRPLVPISFVALLAFSVPGPMPAESVLEAAPMPPPGSGTLPEQARPAAPELIPGVWHPLVAKAAPWPPGARPAEPFRAEASVQPQQVPQGGVAQMVVRANGRVAAASGDLAGAPLAFALDDNTAWALAGFTSFAATGPRAASIEITAGDGQRVSLEVAFEVVPARFPVESIWLQPDQGGLLDPRVLSDEWQRLLALTAPATPQPLWRGEFLPPASGEVSSEYGTRRSYNGGPPTDPHMGVDFAAAYGSPVAAANSGIVVQAGEWQVRGSTVVIDHGVGVYSGYYHLSEIAVASGQKVGKGEIIGKVGASGMATGPHLHWDMIVLGQHTSPLPWTERVLP